MSKPSSLTANEVSERQHFDQMATAYDQNYTYHSGFTQYKIQKKLALLFTGLNSRKKLRILEIGAGTGEYTQHLATFFPNSKITAIDISPKILQVARKKCRRFKNVTFQVASAYDLPYSAHQFDIVTGFYILHHLDQATSIHEVARVLKKGGAALFYEPNILNPAVWAIKNIPILKKWVGDSPEEKAVNPIQLQQYSQQFRQINWQTTEFMAVPPQFPAQVAIPLDKILSRLGSLPLLNMFGGSVAMRFKK